MLPKFEPNKTGVSQGASATGCQRGNFGLLPRGTSVWLSWTPVMTGGCGLNPFTSTWTSLPPQQWSLNWAAQSNWKDFQVARVHFKPSTLSTLTFTSSLSWMRMWGHPVSLSVSALFRMRKFGVKTRFHLSFSRVTLANSYCLFLWLNKQFHVGNEQKRFSRCSIYHSLRIRELLVVLSGFVSKPLKKLT